MNSPTSNLFPLTALIAALSLTLARPVTAQTLTPLHDFNGLDGSNPEAGLVLSGTTLYGTTLRGGSSDNGTVFSVNTDGSGFTTLYSFTRGDDGANPYAGLILSGTTLYGTASAGGSDDSGTVFSFDIDTSTFTTLYSFTATDPATGFNTDGAVPKAGLILSGNTLYGTTVSGGSAGAGTVFRVNTDRSGFTALYSFTGGNDGANPYAGLILSGATLYGTADGGGSAGYGTVFSLTTDGTGFTALYDFSGGNDGAFPYGGLILSGNTLYGTAAGGGSAGYGTVFSLTTDGKVFNTLFAFSGGYDGGEPQAGLILSGNTLYGTAWAGGSSDSGTVFSLHTDGSHFTALSFSGEDDGAWPAGGVVLSGNTLFGTASSDSSEGFGALFSYTPHACNPSDTSLSYAIVNGQAQMYFANQYGLSAVEGINLRNCTIAGGTAYGPGFESGIPVGPITLNNKLALPPDTTNLVATASKIDLNGSATVNAQVYDTCGLGKQFDPVIANVVPQPAPAPSQTYSGVLSAEHYVSVVNGSPGLASVKLLVNGWTYNLNALADGQVVVVDIAAAMRPGTGNSILVLAGGASPASAYVVIGDTASGPVLSVPPQVEAPVLSLVQQAGSVVLSWPAPAGFFTLQGRAGLSSATAWQDLAVTQTESQGWSSVSLPAQAASQLFRLRQ